MLRGVYDEALVLVSIVVAAAASYTALALAERVASASPRAARWWIAGGAFAMGTGIWSMHFIGMLAFQLPIPLGYDFLVTLASWLLPVLVSGVALRLLSRPSWNVRTLLASALLFGIGINAMHYLGMAAMRMEPGIVWDWALVAASLAIAIAAAAASLWIAYQLRSPEMPYVRLVRGAAAIVMGAAIAGMHYTGMAAAGFPEGSVCLAAGGAFGLGELAALVIVATFAILAIALLTAVFDARLEASSVGLAVAERTSRERERLLESERAARSEAERLGALKDQFLATLSHELRTPLNAILGWTQLLRMRRDPSVLDRGLETIERNARLQAQLIEDLLDMSRIVSGQVRLEMRRLDLADVIEAALETTRPAALAKDIELQVHLDRAAGPVWGDAARLQQVLWNLLMNAVKFTPNGGRVQMTLEREGDHAVATVRDNGIGIEPSFLPFVFDRFRQADASTTRRHGGLGIGLSIVHHLVQLHGGTVHAASAGPGHGATFAVKLPIASEAAAADEGTLPPMAPPQPLPQLSGLHVLVVDDDADAQLLARQVLEGCGARVSLASSAAQALALLQRERPQLLVSDIGMPDLDGFHLVRQVRSLPDAQLAAIPALALTAFTRAQDEQRALAEGFQRFVRKPVDAGEFVRQVAALAPRPAGHEPEARPPA